MSEETLRFVRVVLPVQASLVAENLFLRKQVSSSPAGRRSGEFWTVRLCRFRSTGVSWKAAASTASPATSLQGHRSLQRCKNGIVRVEPLHTGGERSIRDSVVHFCLFRARYRVSRLIASSRQTSTGCLLITRICRPVTIGVFVSRRPHFAGIRSAIRSAKAPMVREGLTPRARGTIAPSAT